MTHGDAGAILALGRRRRRPSSAIRRAARERDHGRCRYPGCESRRTDLHHIQHWVNGGPTDLDNLISLCPWHHKVIHDRGYTIAARPGGADFAIIPPWYGERLDLHHAIWTCFANARIKQERERDQDGEPAARGRVTVYEPEDCDERYRQYLEHTPRHTGPILIPIQV
jgi:hypothetical protein